MITPEQAEMHLRAREEDWMSRTRVLLEHALATRYERGKTLEVSVSSWPTKHALERLRVDLREAGWEVSPSLFSTLTMLRIKPLVTKSRPNLPIPFPGRR
jgi:hypothetical protein